MVARIRSLQIDVLLRLYDSIELLIAEKTVSPSHRLTMIISDMTDLVARPFALQLLARSVGLASRIGMFLEVSVLQDSTRPAHPRCRSMTRRA